MGDTTNPPDTGRNGHDMSTRNDPTRDRPEPGPDMASTLKAEVKHCEQRLELARDQLRRWLLSNPEAESVYEKRGFMVHQLDGSGYTRLDGP